VGVPKLKDPVGLSYTRGVLQQIADQAQERLKERLRLFSPTVPKEWFAGVNRLLTTPGNGNELIRAIQPRPEDRRMLAESLGMSVRGASNAMLADLTNQITAGDALRETLNAITAPALSETVKLAATRVLSDQANLARVRIPDETWSQFMSTVQWQRLQKRFAVEAAEAFRAAGLNWERELARLRDDAAQERKRARREVKSRAEPAHAAGGAPDVGLDRDALKVMEALLDEVRSIGADIHSMAANAQRGARMQKLMLLVALISFVMTFLDPPLQVRVVMPMPPVQPDVRSKPPRHKNKARSGKSTTTRPQVKSSNSNATKSKQRRAKPNP
jgi:hypothetical protein